MSRSQILINQNPFYESCCLMAYSLGTYTTNEPAAMEHRRNITRYRDLLRCISDPETRVILEKLLKETEDKLAHLERPRQP